MSEFLLVVEGLMADGADAAMFVSEDTYKGAMFRCVFTEPVHGYVWCDRHGWVRSDEACVCDDCVWEALQAQAEALRKQQIAEFGEDWLDEGDRGEMSYRRINRADPSYEPVYLRETSEQKARRAIFDMAKGKDVSRAFR